LAHAQMKLQIAQVIVMFVHQVTVHQMLLYVPATVMHVLVLVQTIAVRQMLLYVLATVISVLVLVPHITVHQMLLYVLVIVTSVQVLVQHITVQQVMPFALILLPHVPALVAEQFLIVLHVLTIPMVYVDIQLVVVILVAKHMIMVLLAPPVTFVAVALVLRMSRLAPLASTAQPRITGVMARALAPHPQQLPALRTKSTR